jgi:TRAP transporter TAXI family solute receptor
MGIVVSLTAACGSQALEAPPTSIRIASADRALGALLAEVFNAHVPGVQASLDPPETERFSLRAVNEAEADVAFVRADLAYNALSVGTPLHPQAHQQLRGLAVVGWSVLHVVVRADSPARTLADLRGGRLGLASESAVARRRRATDGSTGLFPDLLSASGQLEASDFRKVPLAPDDLIDALAAGDIEGALFLTASPAAFLHRMAGSVDLRLIAIDPAAALRIRAEYPFYKPARIPAGVYPGQVEAVETIGVDSVLVCHAGLPEDVAYALVKAFFESPLELTRASELAGMVDPDLAPATPIPLHPGAARYYRERELPHY